MKRLLKSRRTWILLLSTLLLASLVFNVWLVFKVMDYKGRVLLAREFPDQTPLLVEKDGRTLVWLVGDSRIEAWALPDSSTRKVVNRGSGGFTARETLDRFRADLTAGSRPDVVVVQAGINDVLSAGYNRPSRLTPASAPRPSPDRIMAQCLTDLESLTLTARSTGCRVILLTVFPPGPYALRDRFFWTSELESRIPALNAGLQKLAGPGVEILDAASLLSFGGRTKSEFACDALHLNAAGYRVLTESLEALLSPPVR